MSEPTPIYNTKSGADAVLWEKSICEQATHGIQLNDDTRPLLQAIIADGRFPVHRAAFFAAQGRPRLIMAGVDPAGIRPRMAYELMADGVVRRFGQPIEEE